MSLKDRLAAGLAGQLARPHGAGGRLVAIMLNGSNHGTVSPAVALLALDLGDVAADIGFGGGRSDDLAECIHFAVRFLCVMRD